MSCTAFDVAYVNISLLHLIVLILSHFQEISKKVRTEEQTATKEILQRIFPDIRIEDNKVKYNYFVFFILYFVFSLTFHGSSGATPDLDIDIVNCYTYAYANIVYMLK